MRIQIKIAWAALICCTTMTLHATQQHPLDAALEKCMMENPSTHGMVQCIARYAEKWDDLLKHKLTELAALLRDAGALQQNNALYAAFRESEERLIAGMRGQLDGTMYSIIAADQYLILIRQRTLELEDLRLLLNGDQPHYFSLDDPPRPVDLQVQYTRLLEVLHEENKPYLERSKESWEAYRANTDALLKTLQRARPGIFSDLLRTRLKGAFTQRRASILDSYYLFLSDQ